MRPLPTLTLALLALHFTAPVAPAQELVYQLGAEAMSNADFGRSVADAGDVNLDGVPDVVVGAPFNGSGGTIFVYSGLTGDLLWSRNADFAGDAFGWSVDGIGDITGDGRSEIIVGAPLWDNNGTWDANGGKVYILPGTGAGTVATWSYNSLNARLGQVVRGFGDITGDGVGDFAFSIPYRDSNGLTDNGYVSVYSGATITFLFSRVGTESNAWYGYSLDVVRATGAQATSRWIVGEPGVDGAGFNRGQARLLDGFGNTVSLFAGSTDEEWTGAAVAGLGDANNDGWEDYAIAAPYADILFVGADAGLVRVWSGASTSILFSGSGATAGANFGQSLSKCGDFNGDNRDDVLVGAPNDTSAAVGAGEARVLSGLNGSTLASWYGGLNDHMGRSVSDAGDLNADGFADVIVGANDAPLGAGEAYVYLGNVDSPTIYCTAKVNSQGCTPQISTTGVPSLSIADSFRIEATNVINNKFGLLFWGSGSNNSPFLGGTLCVAPPFTRANTMNSSGNAGPDDCSGTYSIPFDHNYMNFEGLAPGDPVYAQIWSRDPAASFGVGLTDAVSFDVVP